MTADLDPVTQGHDLLFHMLKIKVLLKMNTDVNIALMKYRLGLNYLYYKKYLVAFSYF